MKFTDRVVQLAGIRRSSQGDISLYDAGTAVIKRVLFVERENTLNLIENNFSHLKLLCEVEKLKNKKNSTKKYTGWILSKDLYKNYYRKYPPIEKNRLLAFVYVLQK